MSDNVKRFWNMRLVEMSVKTRETQISLNVLVIIIIIIIKQTFLSRQTNMSYHKDVCSENSLNK